LFVGKRTVLRLQYNKYKDVGLLCNFCNHQYSQFVPHYPSYENKEALIRHQVIAGYGENIFCPYCLSSARERLVRCMLVQEDIKNKQILHFSPERSIFNYIAQFADVTIADLNPELYLNISRKVKRENLLALSFSTSSFDFVIANHVLEHIFDDLSAMYEIFRVLKPGGVAILQVPFSNSLINSLETEKIINEKQASALFGQKDHVRIYTLNDYMKKLQSVGFICTLISYEVIKRNFFNLALQPNEHFIKIKRPIV